MVTEALINAKSNKKTTGQDITNKSLPAGDQALDYLTYIYDFAKPGTLNSIDRIMKGAQYQGSPDEYGKIYKFGDETLAAFGGQRISSIDVNKSFSFLSGTMKETILNSKKIYTGLKQQEQPSMSEGKKKEIKESKEEALKKSVIALKGNIKELRSMYFGAIALGVPSKDLKETIAKNRMPKDIMRLVYSETPLDKMKLPHFDWKKQKETFISLDEYLTNYLTK